jgi:hypothetical protein
MPRIRAAAALLGTIGALGGGAAFCGSAAAAAPSPTWSGADAGLGVSSLWSDPGNWVGGVAPASDRRVATLTFPSPDSTECPDGACRTSDNDLTGVSVGTLAIGQLVQSNPDEYEAYTLTGNALRIDRLVSTDGPTAPISATLNLPIILGRDQTWHLESSLPTSLTGRHALTIDLTSGAFLPSDTEVGRLNLDGLTVTGQLSSVIFSGGESLNARDGQPVRLDRVSVRSLQDSPDGVKLSTGPLSISDAVVALGGQSAEEGLAAFTAILSTEGTRLDAGTSLDFSLGSEIVSRGPVDLAGATLNLYNEHGLLETCGSVPAGTSYPIVTAQGRLRGGFANAPPRSTVQVGCGLYRLQYRRWPRPGTAAGVTAVLIGDPTITDLQAPSTATVGTPVTLTADTSFLGPDGYFSDTVSFDVDGQTIPGCETVPGTPGGPSIGAQQATCTTTFTSAGPHTINAVATPSAPFLPSSATATVTVTQSG